MRQCVATTIICHSRTLLLWAAALVLLGLVSLRGAIAQRVLRPHSAKSPLK